MSSATAYKRKLYEDYEAEWNVERTEYWFTLLQRAVNFTQGSFPDRNPMRGEPPPYPSKRRKCATALREEWKRRYGNPPIEQDN